MPSKRANNLVLVMCDECQKDIQIASDAWLPAPWREVKMDGWIGVMHACSDEHEVGVRHRHEKKKEPSCE